MKRTRIEEVEDDLGLVGGDTRGKSLLLEGEGKKKKGVRGKEREE